MKLTIALLLIAFLSLAAAAQSESAEKNFARDIRKLKVEKYSMGEDASSGYDYLVYKKKGEIVKIRTIWSSSANPKWWVEDAYYAAGEPVLLVKLSLTRRQFKPVKGGRLVALPVEDKFYFKDGKLVKWLEKGKVVPATDTRWQEVERDALASAKDTIEFYPELKDL